MKFYVVGNAMVVAACCLLAGAKITATTKPAEKGIQGIWKWVSDLDQGNEIPWPETNRLVITAELMTIVYSKDDSSGWRYTIDPSKNPKEMDWLPEETPGQPILNPAIYSLDGDTLKIASTAQDKPRPTDFKSKKGDFGGVWILKRVAAPTTMKATK